MLIKERAEEGGGDVAQYSFPPHSYQPLLALA
jgi:hypothetical protein